MSSKAIVRTTMIFWLIVLVIIAVNIYILGPINPILHLIWLGSGVISAIIMGTCLCKPKGLSDLGLYFIAFLLGPYVILVTGTVWGLKICIKLKRKIKAIIKPLAGEHHESRRVS